MFVQNDLILRYCVNATVDFPVCFFCVSLQIYVIFQKVVKSRKKILFWIIIITVITQSFFLSFQIAQFISFFRLFVWLPFLKCIITCWTILNWGRRCLNFLEVSSCFSQKRIWENKWLDVFYASEKIKFCVGEDWDYDNSYVTAYLGVFLSFLC